MNNTYGCGYRAGRKFIQNHVLLLSPTARKHAYVLTPGTLATSNSYGHEDGRVWYFHYTKLLSLGNIYHNEIYCGGSSLK